jgi:photosystem II stability/assembly factor-like uncharacterized protein
MAHLTEVPTDLIVVATSSGLAVPGGAREHLAGSAVTALHVSAGATWVVVGGRHLYRLEGARRSLVASLDDVGAICVIEHRGDIFVGGSDARLWRLDDGALEPVESFLDAPTRERWSTPWGGPPDVYSMASHGDDLYVGVHVGGIIRSSDGGRSWEPTVDLDVDVHQVVVDVDGDLWAATGMRGLGHSTDRGGTWTFHSRGLHAGYLLAVAAASDGVLVGASSGPHADDGALYRFADGMFERCAGLPADLGGAISPRHVAAQGDDVVVALPNGDVYGSTDSGRSWSIAAEALPGVSGVALRTR